MEYFSKDLFLLFSIEDVRIEFLTYRGRKDLEGGGRFVTGSMPVLAEVSFTILPIGDSSGRWPPSQRNRLGARPDFRHGRAIPNLLLLRLFSGK